MAKIIIYTKDHCPYCVKAKQLLKIKKQEFTEKDIGKDEAARAEMQSKAPNARTVPQIFIGDTHVGGCDDLYALNDSGALDKLLAK
jgi:glutaredoxin 3